MYSCILVFFTVFLKNRNISSKIKRSKVTDYAALNVADLSIHSLSDFGAYAKLLQNRCYHLNMHEQLHVSIESCGLLLL